MIYLLILVCFLISGLTGLVYEVLWTRMIVKVIGTSPFSVTIILTVFMAGLGFGSWLAGRLIDRAKAPERLIRAYGVLELAVGAYCLVLPSLLRGFEPVCAALYNRLFQHFLLYNLLTFAGCAVLLIVPVTCMGATLPVLCRFFVTSLSKVGTHVGRLYGLNTVGAAAGSLLCGFWLVNALGVRGVLALAVALNALVGALCVFVSFRVAGKVSLPGDGTASAPAAMAAAGGDAPQGARKAKGSKGAKPATGAAPFPLALVLAAFAVSGFCSMSYEVLWTKLLGLLVGPTTYSFTVVLVAFIAGLAVGGMVWGWLGDRSRNPVALLAATQVAAALAALLFSQVMGNSQIFFAKLIYEFQDDFFTLNLLKGLCLFGFMILTTFFLGAAFPLVGRICTRTLEGAGKSIGYAYAVNSAGAVLGSFVAGFVLLPFLGKEDGIRLVVGLQLASALLLWARGMETWKMPLARKAAVVGAAVFAAALMFFFPRWDHVMLSMGKYHRFNRPEIRQVGWLAALFDWERRFPDLKNEKLLFYGDGIGGFTTVLETTGVMGDVNYNLCNSGKPDASSTRDMDTQTLLAHFALLNHPDVEDALVIGLGSGITAGEILHYPVKRLDVVEINEQVVDASRYFLEWNNHVLEDPRTRLIIQDGRAHLALTDRKYDLVTSEPSNPWMSGIAALYTKDFFDLVAARLKPGGMFVQWIPAYQMDWVSFNLIGRTFAAAFPESLMLTTNPARPSSFLFVGSKGGLKLDPAVAAHNLRYAQKSPNVTLRSPLLFYNLVVSDDLRNLFGKGPLNTDDLPLLEYRAPKTMHETDESIVRRIGIAVGSTLGEDIASVRRANQSDVDGQIDYAEYFLRFRGGDDLMLQYPVNLAAASPAQKARYFGIVEDFCAANMVADFSQIRDSELRDRCLSRQEATLLGQVERGGDLPDRRKAAIYGQLGRMGMQWQRPEAAVGYFAQEAAFSPGDATARNNLGIACIAARQFARAEEELAVAVRLDAGYARAHANLGRAIALQGGGRIDEAVAHFRDAARLDPNDAETCNHLGAALMERGDFDEARVWIERALQIRPDFGAARLNLQRLAAR
ncbi:MAG: fused MFS/spermidine synthase [Acidobacteriota bacterium]|jgi:spermidine synthase|nr:fused MFS/spermidine synthase [Acidobacteriota bacterium]